MSDQSGGTPTSPEEQSHADQLAQLRSVIIDAFRLLPAGTGGVAGAGAGQGEGVSAEVVDAVMAMLTELQSVTGGGGIGALDWLTTGLRCAPPGEAGDPTAATLALRDLLLDGLQSLGDGQAAIDASQAEQAASDFALGTVEVETA